MPSLVDALGLAGPQPADGPNNLRNGRRVGFVRTGSDATVGWYDAGAHIVILNVDHPHVLHLVVRRSGYALRVVLAALVAAPDCGEALARELGKLEVPHGTKKQRRRI